MYGRSCMRLLAALFFFISLGFAQSPKSQRSVPSASEYSDLAPKSADRNPRTIRGRNGAVVFTPPFPTASGSPPHPTPVPQPLPWRPPISSPPSGFGRLARSAGIIFSGTVTNIARTSEYVPGQAVGTVAITFHVERAIRGATSGESLTITQWIGLWSSGQRFRTGERVLLFLYPRSRIGLTSCVGAGMGRFAVDSAGRIRLSAEQILAFRTDPVLGGKSRVRLSDFASAVRWAGEEE